MKNERQSNGGCDATACGSIGRRTFIQSSSCAGLVTLLGLPVFAIDGEQNGGEKRYPIPAGDSVNVDRGAQLIVVRTQGRVFVFALACPHENNVVKWVQKERRFQCTKHDSQYQPDGVHTSGRATRNMDRYAIRRDGDAIAVDLHRWFQSDKDPGGWAAATIAV